MSIELRQTNHLIDCKQEKLLSSLVKVAFWLLVLLFLPQIILSLLFGVFFGFWQAGEVTTNSFNTWYSTMPVLLTLSLISPVLTIPLLMKATNAENWPDRFNLWAIKAMVVSLTAKWLMVGFVFWLTSSFVGEWLKLPEEQFVLDIKAAGNSVGMVVLISFTLCVIIPIMEELIFRGWLFTKVEQTQLGSIGALILTAILFTIIHSQYENNVTFIMLLFFGLLLGYTRYKSNNISYSIAIHILFNGLAYIVMFL
jgi:membrane protease YdiL (CAAX protease family)